jgi:hypothetical protein
MPDTTAIQNRLLALLEAGRRNNARDQRAIQAIHDGSAMLGADCAATQQEAERWLSDTAELLEAELSFSDIERALRAAIAGKVGKGTAQNPAYTWLRDVYDDYCVYSVEDAGLMDAGALYRVNYSMDPDGKITLGDPLKVMPQTTYIPVAEAKTSPAGDVEEAADADIGGDIIPLVEKAVSKDNTLRLKVIAPGWGSSGYYPAAVLERDGSNAFPAGTKMFWNHPTVEEAAARPERDLRDLAAELITPATWDGKAAEGPGLYAEAKVFGGYKDALQELAPHIGVSIRASGKARSGEAEGRRGAIVESIVAGKSVDFVTQAGAGGKVLELFEAARGGTTPAPATHHAEMQEGGTDVDEKQLQALQETVNRLETRTNEVERENTALKADNARLKEGLLLREARDFAAGELAKVEMPELTRTRLLESLAGKPPVVEGVIDQVSYRAQISEAVKTELQYLAGVTGNGTIRGMGSGGLTPQIATVEEAQTVLAGAMSRIGLSESAAKSAASGR